MAVRFPAELGIPLGWPGGRMPAVSRVDMLQTWCAVGRGMMCEQEDMTSRCMMVWACVNPNNVSRSKKWTPGPMCRLPLACLFDALGLQWPAGNRVELRRWSVLLLAFCSHRAISLSHEDRSSSWFVSFWDIWEGLWRLSGPVCNVVCFSGTKPPKFEAYTGTGPVYASFMSAAKTIKPAKSSKQQASNTSPPAHFPHSDHNSALIADRICMASSKKGLEMNKQHLIDTHTYIYIFKYIYKNMSMFLIQSHVRQSSELWPSLFWSSRVLNERPSPVGSASWKWIHYKLVSSFWVCMPLRSQSLPQSVFSNLRGALQGSTRQSLHRISPKICTVEPHSQIQWTFFSSWGLAFTGGNMQQHADPPQCKLSCTQCSSAAPLQGCHSARCNCHSADLCILHCVAGACWVCAQSRRNLLLAYSHRRLQGKFCRWDPWDVMRSCVLSEGGCWRR